jgi:hypothetical protein
VDRVKAWEVGGLEGNEEDGEELVDYLGVF